MVSDDDDDPLDCFAWSFFERDGSCTFVRGRNWSLDCEGIINITCDKQPETWTVNSRLTQGCILLVPLPQKCYTKHYKEGFFGCDLSPKISPSPASEYDAAASSSSVGIYHLVRFHGLPATYIIVFENLVRGKMSTDALYEQARLLVGLIWAARIRIHRNQSYEVTSCNPI